MTNCETVKLKTGEPLVISEVEPPLGRFADSVGCWWEAVEEDLLVGTLAP